MKFKKLLAVSTTALLAIGLVGAGVISASADSDHKVTICHANEGVKGWSPNGNSVDKDSIMNPLGAGHDSHADDIIPAFPAGSHGGTSWDAYPGKNLNTLFDGVPGSVILANGCSIPTTPQDASASATSTAATCDAPGGVNFAIENATWENTTDLTDGSRTAIADTGHLFPGGASTLVVTYTIAPQLTGDQCGSLPCLTSSAVSYTYNAITNSGVITVVAQDGHSSALCNPFWVTAASWTFDGNTMWPQTLDKWVPANGGQQISSVGTYAYGATVTCGQGDIYATFNSPGVPYPTGGVLNGPSNPYAEHFLHQMGFSGPNPTWTVQDASACNPNVVETVPAVTFTDVCGIANDGIVGGTDTASIDYTITDNRVAGVGTVTATAVAKSGYVFANGAYTGPWSHTFTNEACPVVSVDVAPFATDQECVPSQPEAEFTTLSAPAGYTYEDGGITVALDANLEYTITGTGSTVYGPTVVTSAFTALDPGTYDVTVRALNGYVLGEGQSSWSLTVDEGLCAVTFGDPYAVDQVCSETGISAGYIWVDFSGNLANELDYHIVGPGTDFLATQEINNLPPGAYTVTAVAKSGFVLDSSEQSVWPLTIGTSGDCQLISHPPVTPIASMSNLKCTGGGSYTLAATEGVLWFVNGSPTPTAPGTYPVGTASTVNVVAQLVNDVDYTWEEGAQTEWTFDFTLPVDCIPTLAFTGASGGEMGLLLSGGLLLFGGTIIALERRFRSKTR